MSPLHGWQRDICSLHLYHYLPKSCRGRRLLKTEAVRDHGRPRERNASSHGGAQSLPFHTYCVLTTLLLHTPQRKIGTCHVEGIPNCMILSTKVCNVHTIAVGAQAGGGGAWRRGLSQALEPVSRACWRCREGKSIGQCT